MRAAERDLDRRANASAVRGGGSGIGDLRNHAAAIAGAVRCLDELIGVAFSARRSGIRRVCDHVSS
jgi:hypothetical protein